jgi:hypothetical protein
VVQSRGLVLLVRMLLMLWMMLLLRMVLLVLVWLLGWVRILGRIRMLVNNVRVLHWLGWHQLLLEALILRRLAKVTVIARVVVAGAPQRRVDAAAGAAPKPTASAPYARHAVDISAAP